MPPNVAAKRKRNVSAVAVAVALMVPVCVDECSGVKLKILICFTIDTYAFIYTSMLFNIHRGRGRINSRGLPRATMIHVSSRAPHITLPLAFPRRRAHLHLAGSWPRRTCATTRSKGTLFVGLQRHVSSYQPGRLISLPRLRWSPHPMEGPLLQEGNSHLDLCSECRRTHLRYRLVCCDALA